MVFAMTQENVTERILEICEELDKTDNKKDSEELLLIELEKLCSLSVRMRSNKENFLI